MKKTLPLIVATIVLCLRATAQSPSEDAASHSADTVRHSSVITRIIKYFQNSNTDKTLTKKIDFSVIGGPNYSSNTGFGIGVVAAALYRIDRSDLTMPPSNTSLYSDISTTGFVMVGIRGNTLFREQKHRMDYNVYFFYKPTYFWGVGYDAAENNERSSYTRLETQFEANFMFRMMKNTYIGAGLSYDYVIGRKFTHPEYIPEGESEEYMNAGVSGSIVYDSRDLINNAYKGLYMRLQQTFYPAFAGNSGYFARTEFTFDYYRHAWKGAVAAVDVHSQFNYGGAPWTMMAQVGSPYRMRGYYEGRYRDNHIIEIQAEIRQKIYGRSGAAVWVGAGNVFPSFDGFDWSHTLPNYGLGYRWEFKKRVNIRLDYGFGKEGQNGFIFNINEAF